jgi:hypothetical protein
MANGPQFDSDPPRVPTPGAESGRYAGSSPAPLPAPRDCDHPTWIYAFHQDWTWYTSACTTCDERAVHHIDRIEWTRNGFTYRLKDRADA